MKPKIAIIGAGIAGAACAASLHANAHVDIFEKSRGVGGRLSHRRTNETTIDFGAPYFSITTSEFKSTVMAWQHHGLAEKFDHFLIRDECTNPELTTFWVGIPTMSSLVKNLLENMTINTQTRIKNIDIKQDRKHIIDENQQCYGPYDWIILAIPPAQALELLPENFSQRQIVANVKMTSCWTTLLAFEKPAVDEAIKPTHSTSLQRIIINSLKPGRSPLPQTFTLYATEQWTNENVDKSSEWIQHAMYMDFLSRLNLSAITPAYIAAHRWLYANPTNPLKRHFLIDPALKIGVCGDWCHTGDVEGAYLSGKSLAEELLINQLT